MAQSGGNAPTVTAPPAPLPCAPTRTATPPPAWGDTQTAPPTPKRAARYSQQDRSLAHVTPRPGHNPNGPPFLRDRLASFGPARPSPQPPPPQPATHSGCARSDYRGNWAQSSLLSAPRLASPSCHLLSSLCYDRRYAVHLHHPRVRCARSVPMDRSQRAPSIRSSVRPGGPPVRPGGTPAGYAALRPRSRPPRRPRGDAGEGPRPTTRPRPRQPDTCTAYRVAPRERRPPERVEPEGTEGAPDGEGAHQREPEGGAGPIPWGRGRPRSGGNVGGS